jgi:hypothetical protein
MSPPVHTEYEVAVSGVDTIFSRVTYSLKARDCLSNVLKAPSYLGINKTHTDISQSPVASFMEKKSLFVRRTKTASKIQTVEEMLC